MDNLKTCDSCGKDYPVETNKFCPECFTTEAEAKEYDNDAYNHETHTQPLAEAIAKFTEAQKQEIRDLLTKN